MNALDELDDLFHTVPVGLAVLDEKLRCALGMVGYRWHDGDDAPEENDWILNVSVFRNISHSLTFGVENDYVNDGDVHWKLLVMPQHHELTEHVELQWGVGVEFTPEEKRCDCCSQVDLLSLNSVLRLNPAATTDNTRTGPSIHAEVGHCTSNR